MSLATQYFVGQGAPKDYKLAARWYQAAAEAGDPGAQYIIAHMFEEGYGKARDTRLAAYWYRQAADQGDPAAQVKYETLSAQLANEAEH